MPGGGGAIEMRWTNASWQLCASPQALHFGNQVEVASNREGKAIPKDLFATEAPNASGGSCCTTSARRLGAMWLMVPGVQRAAVTRLGIPPVQLGLLPLLVQRPSKAGRRPAGRAEPVTEQPPPLVSGTGKGRTGDQAQWSGSCIPLPLGLPLLYPGLPVDRLLDASSNANSVPTRPGFTTEDAARIEAYSAFVLS